MALLKTIDPKDATGRTKELFEELEHGVGRVPAMIRVMANSPAILDTYVHFNRALEQTALTPTVRFLITVAVAELHGCDYTLSIGMALARKAGVSEDALSAARLGKAADRKTAETLRFATGIVQRAGNVPATEVERLQAEGFSDAEIVDIIAVVSVNVFRNYFNLVTETDVDLPLVRTHSPQPA